MSDLVILNWRPFECKTKFLKKIAHLFRSKVDIFDIFFEFSDKFFIIKFYKSLVDNNSKQSHNILPIIS